ncbi:MAG: class I SAM-dependent methyltransferase [Opitutales bacterium]|jgi:23S rRNA (cytosine1962-C5)-methyltransferase
MATGPVILSADWDAYSLIDCGNRRKLERFGDQLLIRGEPKAWWEADAGIHDWRKADAEIGDAGGKWKLRQNPPRKWTLNYGDLKFEARLTDMSKHVGIFPEQEPHWRWLSERLSRRHTPRVLNLFGYTGGATLVAAAAGAEVTHVDASKPAINWARHNQELSGLGKAPIRWILDDAFKFVAREVRRARVYDAILLDPPSFGRGPKGELWKVEQQITSLLENIRNLMVKRGGMIVLTMYNLEASSLMLKCLMEDYFPNGQLEYGELALPCQGSARVLPLSLFARWEG